MAYFGNDVYLDSNADLENNFWKDFYQPKTLGNAIQHFVTNFPYDDEKYLNSFVQTIVQNQILRKKVDKRKLKELVDLEIKKSDKSKITIQNRNDPTKTKIEKLSVFQADRLDGNSFQDFIAEVLKENGFSNVEVTGRSGDQGGDLLANKDDKRIVIQAKRYSIDSKVSNSAVQEAYGAIAYYDADIGAVITNTLYTNGAKELAKKTGITLWNRQDLMKFIAKYNGDDDE